MASSACLLVVVTAVAVAVAVVALAAFPFCCSLHCCSCQNSLAPSELDCHKTCITVPSHSQVYVTISLCNDLFFLFSIELYLPISLHLPISSASHVLSWLYSHFLKLLRYPVLAINIIRQYHYLPVCSWPGASASFARSACRGSPCVGSETCCGTRLVVTHRRGLGTVDSSEEACLRQGTNTTDRYITGC